MGEFQRATPLRVGAHCRSPRVLELKLVGEDPGVRVGVHGTASTETLTSVGAYGCRGGVGTFHPERRGKLGTVLTSGLADWGR